MRSEIRCFGRGSKMRPPFWSLVLGVWYFSNAPLIESGQFFFGGVLAGFVSDLLPEALASGFVVLLSPEVLAGAESFLAASLYFSLL